MSVALMLLHGTFDWVHPFWVHPFLDLSRMCSPWVETLSYFNSHLKTECQLLFEGIHRSCGIYAHYRPLRKITFVSADPWDTHFEFHPTLPLFHPPLTSLLRSKSDLTGSISGLCSMGIVHDRLLKCLCLSELEETRSLWVSPNSYLC